VTRTAGISPDMLTAPLDDAAQLSWTTGAVPADAVALRTRDGHPWCSRATNCGIDRSAEVTPKVALLGSCCALGALHAFSPGHGKTVVSAYVGSGYAASCSLPRINGDDYAYGRSLCTRSRNAVRARMLLPSVYFLS